MSTTFVPMSEVIPEGVHGVAKVEHFSVDKHASAMTAFHSFSNRDAYVPEGRYARLYVDGTLFMSDTPMEQRTNYDVVRHAHGRVLIAGLGLGLILVPILRKKEVTHVTVVEQPADVVALISPHFSDKRLRIVTADIHEWKPPKGDKFNAIYFDIWADQSTDCLADMGKLHRKFAARLDRTDDARWMDSWCRDILLYDKRREAREEAAMNWWRS